MSSVRDKLYNQEIIPPADTWEKVAVALNESELENKFPASLYNIAIDPPANAWQEIADTLDKEQLQFPSRLYNMEVVPPITMWQKLAASLNPTGENAGTPVKKMFPILRYAAAAIFIGIIAYGIIRLVVNTAGNENSIVNTASKDSSSNNEATGRGTTQIPEGSNENEEEVVIKKSNNVLAKFDKPVKKTVKTVVSSADRIENDPIDVDPNLSRSIYAYADYIPNIADRYVMLMTPDGNIIRMSKKWGDLLCCVSGEEQDADCKNQLKKWQEKMASSTLAPSPGNFMDILGLVNSLDESNGL
jgi:hypothetical protein